MKIAQDNNRLGFVVYFDIRPSLELMSKEQIADLFMAMLNYTQYGEAPELDLATQICFNGIKSRLDYDAVKYDKSILQRKYAVYVREEKKATREPMPFDTWANLTQAKADAISRLNSHTIDR